MSAISTTYDEREELRSFLEIIRKINRGQSLDEVLSYIYDAFKAVIPYDRLGCALLEKASGIVRTLWARSEWPLLEIRPGFWAPLQGSSLERILDTGEPRILNDLERYLADHPGSESTRKIVREGIRSSLTCPLIADGAPIGFLFFSSRSSGTYREAHAAAYTRIAAHVSVIVEKSRIHAEMLEARRLLTEANRALEQAANVDALTRLPNRRLFDLVYEREWSRAVRLLEPLAVIAADIDCFKQYNDRYGHQAGDECLRRVAAALATAAQRGTDLVARWGGEEFMAVLPRTGADEAAALAESMRAGVESLAIPNVDSEVAPVVTLSLGVAGSLPERGGTAEELLARADAALYRAKRAGRNRVGQDGK